jgi:glycosyltransferase involved in cell wall biosynthesis
MYCNCYPLLPKRLAYPEHIPEDFHQKFFYEDFDDLVEKLRNLILNIREVRQENIQTFAVKYDWQRMAPRYDETLSQVMVKSKKNQV